MYSTWFCIPKMDVTGTITLEGEEKTVHGDGYHDHRCMKLDDMKAWHHWIWGRQHFENYTVVIFDLVSGERFGFVQVPLFAVYNKEGDIIFENNGPANCEIKGRYWEEGTKKHYPTEVTFHYTNGEDSVDYTLTWKEQMEARDMYTPFPDPVKQDYDAWNLRPSYMRYNSRGDMTLNIGGKTDTVSGMMIYELAFPGKESELAHM